MENHLKLVQHLLTDETTTNEEKINLIKNHFTEERIKEIDDLIAFAENVKIDIENGHFDLNNELVAKDYYLKILSINESNISFF